MVIISTYKDKSSLLTSLGLMLFQGKVMILDHRMPFLIQKFLKQKYKEKQLQVSIKVLDQIL